MANEQMALNAPIVEVTVFSNRARVTRRGLLHLGPGEHTLALVGLPALLEEDSVRASGRGANVRLLGVEVGRQFVPRPPEADVAALQQQLEALRDADQALADDETATAVRLQFLNMLSESGAASLARGFALGRSTLDSLQTLTAYLDREFATVQAHSRDLAQQRRAGGREIAAAEARLAGMHPQDSPERRVIDVTVEAAEEADFQLDVLYAVPDAAWKPLYDIRLVENHVVLSYLAAVHQQSGEDWPAIPLALSTARPAVSATIPRLMPVYVDSYRSAPVYRGAPPMAPMAQAAPGGMPRDEARTQDLLTDQLDALAEPLEAEIESTGATVTYRVGRPVAVPGDGSPHRTTITTLELDADLDYITVPKLAEEAYLRARVKNVSPYTLLPGAANIFHDAEFVGTTTLKTVAPNETFEVQLGVDDRIKVTRELAERTTARTALVGTVRRTQFAYKITLTNHLARPATVLVRDQLPVARHEDIKVRLQEAQPRPNEQTALNILEWTVPLAPQEKRDITFTYTIEHPRTLQVSGVEQ
jgi:uncharacterized protein (TIGR02231 family)